MRCDAVWHNARLATMTGTGLGCVEDGIIAAADGFIVYAGPAAAVPGLEPAARHDCGGRWITPGLIDCHTHLVYAGDRAQEFALRLAGASYEEIARAGGGIVSTVRATRAASEAELLRQARQRLQALIAEGVTTIEIKSGYGLTTEVEARLLAVARQLGETDDVQVRTSFLGAHAVPPEYRDDPDAYVDLVCREMIPAIAAAGLADAVDGFCEGIAFTPDQIARVFAAARAHGLPVKLHAEQLSRSGGTQLVARAGGLSADHLEHADGSDVAAMARTVDTMPPPARAISS
jgi:imidazolonepropionase